MKSLLKSYAEGIAGACLTEDEAVEFLKGIEGYEVYSYLSDKGQRKKNNLKYSREAQNLLDAKRSNRFFASVTAYSRPRRKTTSW